MSTISQGHSDFAARIARIESGAATYRQLLFVGIDEVYQLPLRVRKIKESPVKALFRNAMYPVSMALALVLGAVSHGLGQVARYHLQGMPNLNANPDIEILGQIVIGFSIAMVLGSLIGLRSRALTTLKSTGAALGVLLFHNAVQLYPEIFTVLTSKIWVNQIVSHTEVYSILWRGISFTL